MNVPILAILAAGLGLASCSATPGNGAAANTEACRTELVFADHQTELTPALRRTIDRMATAAIAQDRLLGVVSPTQSGQEFTETTSRHRNVVSYLQQYETKGLKIADAYQPADFAPIRNMVLDMCP